MQSEKYYNLEGLSSSSIKDFEWMSPSDWKSIYIDKNIVNQQNKLHFDKGSLLDSLLLDPENVEKNFYFCPTTTTSTSDVMQKIIESIWNKTKEQLLDVAETMELKDEFLDKTILASAKEFNYGNNKYSEERILKDVRKHTDYFDFLKAAKDKTIISFSDNLLAIEKKNILLKTEYTKSFFTEEPDEILEHHVQIQLKEDVIPLKGELDILRIVPKEKTIYIADLKTTHTISAFTENVRKYSYATQLSFYRHLFLKVLHNSKNIFISCKNDFEEFKDYKIICCNIVIDDKSKIPQIFRYTEDTLNYYEYGNTTLLKNKYPNIRYKRGWKNTLEIIKEHFKIDNWELPIGHINKGYTEIDLINGITE